MKLLKINDIGDYMGVEYGEFKGHKMIILKKDDNDYFFILRFINI